MSERVTGGEIVAAFLEAAGLRAAFGVISIHNMPMLDAIMRRGVIRCVPARGEAGATNMADAYARVTGGLGVAFTSTGTAAGNACGGMVEALTAGTPLLHITGQIDVPFLDRDRSYIHEARDQMSMLRAVSKRAYRVWSVETLLGTLREAVAVALTPPAGPVSIEIPIDVQGALSRCRRSRSCCRSRRRKRRSTGARSKPSRANCAEQNARCFGSAADRAARPCRCANSSISASPS
jgi:acetolactate synthase-1/2/3 large subunit